MKTFLIIINVLVLVISLLCGVLSVKYYTKRKPNFDFFEKRKGFKNNWLAYRPAFYCVLCIALALFAFGGFKFIFNL